jgi:alpha-mannosidase
VSLEEEGGGLALLNDCKYGHDAEGGRVRLTLLRSPIAPDPDADMGEHRFTYALLPFEGSFGQSGVIRSSYELNIPARAVPAFAAAGEGLVQYSLFSIKGENVIVETIKAPEGTDSGKSLVLRLYESLGGPAKTVLYFNRLLASAGETDMLEGNKREITVNGKELYLEFRAFEIKTVMVSFL